MNVIATCIIITNYEVNQVTWCIFFAKIKKQMTKNTIYCVKSKTNKIDWSYHTCISFKWRTKEKTIAEFGSLIESIPKCSSNKKKLTTKQIAQFSERDLDHKCMWVIIYVSSVIFLMTHNNNCIWNGFCFSLLYAIFHKEKIQWIRKNKIYQNRFTNVFLWTIISFVDNNNCEWIHRFFHNYY